MSITKVNKLRDQRGSCKGQNFSITHNSDVGNSDVGNSEVGNSKVGKPKKFKFLVNIYVMNIIVPRSLQGNA